MSRKFVYYGAGRSAGALLLDLYPAAAGYFLFKLKSDATRSIRVRRSSDNAEMDIGFDGIDLDTTELLSFVGSGNGFITIWYDQMGNSAYNYSQSNASLQQQIVFDGVLDLSLLGKPAAGRDNAPGVTHYYTISGYPFPQDSENTFFSLTAPNQNDTRSWIFDASNQANFGDGGTIRLDNSTATRQGTFNSSTADFLTTTAQPANTPELRVNIIKNTGREIYRNNSLIASDAKAGGVDFSRTIASTELFGYKYATAGGAIGFGMILYTNDQSANRTAIQDIINDYYGIY